MLSERTQFERYPLIKELCVSMACCNGGINRARSVASFLRAAEPIVFALAHALEDLQAIENWLAGLTEEQRLNLADGDYDENRALLATAPGGEFFDHILDRVFEEAV